MKVEFFNNNIGAVQEKMYDGVHYFENSVCGKIMGKPVAALAGVADTTLSVVKYPLNTIEAVVITVFNLVGAVFSKACRDDLVKESVPAVFLYGAYTVATILTSPAKLVCQVVLGLWNHQAIDTVAMDSDGIVQDYDSFFYTVRTPAATPVVTPAETTAEKNVLEGADA